MAAVTDPIGSRVSAVSVPDEANRGSSSGALILLVERTFVLACARVSRKKVLCGNFLRGFFQRFPHRGNCFIRDGAAVFALTRGFLSLLFLSRSFSHETTMGLSRLRRSLENPARDG